MYCNCVFYSILSLRVSVYVTHTEHIRTGGLTEQL
jgi:hypothetical protein